jgi:hypothetical protein
MPNISTPVQIDPNTVITPIDQYTASVQSTAPITKTVDIRNLIQRLNGLQANDASIQLQIADIQNQIKNLNTAGILTPS